MRHYDVIIVGGGIVGAATFYKMQKRYPEMKMLLIDKMDVLADHQTGNNSGVIHSGLYYKPGSLKAENCVKGRHELVKFAKENNVPHDVCGKIVVAATQSEQPSLNRIHKLGLENKIEGIELINGSQIRDIEPECRGAAALWVPCTGIIDFRDATRKMVDVALAIQEQSAVHLSEEVYDFANQGDGTLVKTSRATYIAQHLIVCGGLQADRLARRDGVKLRERVVGFRGDYYELNDHAKHKIRNLIYPVPNPDFPFLGVHFTRMTSGEIECGPNAVFTFKREGYGKTDFDLRDTLDALTYAGTWKLFFNNISFGINEYRRAFSKKHFLKSLQHLVPSLTMDDIRPGRSGVRAMLLNTDGDTRDDFRIESTDRSIHILNAPSPAATASLAIGDYVVDRYAEQFAK
jgi:(S)-2-hydroxyglutarate dehydrogenase